MSTFATVIPSDFIGIRGPMREYRMIFSREKTSELYECYKIASVKLIASLTTALHFYDTNQQSNVHNFSWKMSTI